MKSLISVRRELRAYQEAGVFTVADVHTAVHVGRLGGETDERVLLGLALAVRALRQGSVCVELDRLGRASSPTWTPRLATMIRPDRGPRFCRGRM